MKSINNDDHNSNNTNWLGFSLSPLQMKMEIPSTSSTASSSSVSAIPASFFQSNMNYGSYCGGVEGENNGGLYSSLPIMPLKSDGSLCLMEALTTRSQTQATWVETTTSTPKLEDFFGGATMGTGTGTGTETMYYNHHQPNNHQIQLQHYPFYSNSNFIRSYEMLQNQVSESNNNNNVQIQCIGGDDMRNWVSSEQQKMIISCMGDNNNNSSSSNNNNNNSGAISAMAYGDLQSLSLSMSPGSQSSCVTGSQTAPLTTDSCLVIMETKKRGPGKLDQKQPVHRKSIDTFGQRTSQYRGVTRHRWTGRYEAHLWDNSCKKEGQSRKGRQVYLGGYDMEEKAARAYDQAALKYWGPSTHINFNLEDYQNELEEMKNMTRQEYVAHLRRKSSGFSRGASMYRGVTRHHQHGRWQARIGRVAGNKDLYLGTFSTQEEAAEAYDIAAIKFRGVNAVTNFDITRYDVERIMASNTLVAGEVARRKASEEKKNDWKMSVCQSDQSSNNIAGGNQISNASSLVTSLSSSREATPDHSASLPMLLGLPPSATSKLNSWIPTGPQLPVFAAWTDAN